MRASKWGSRLAARLPRSLLGILRLKAGDELQVASSASSQITLARDKRRERAVERMRKRALGLPQDHFFDRNEANAR